MKKYIRYAMISWAVLSSVFFILSYLKVRNSGDGWNLILWGSMWGAFIWEDLLILSVYNVVASIIVLILKDNRYVFVFGLFFWLIRSLGEVQYWFLQQFNQPVGFPHNQYDWKDNGLQRTLLGDLSDQNYFIIYQVSMQVIAVICLVGLSYLFLNWKQLGKKLN
ncbi:MAG: hypothetical protein PHS44_08005 [Candidatus Dojkabacteria bacterium]|nr:hypothetical protein [Candidatus Dojkabacteria bacterium]